MRRPGCRHVPCASVGCALLLALVGAAGARAEPGPGGSLFRPTPSSQLRELSTDRPDLTESPATVDAGHFQLEVEAVRHTRDESRDGHARSTGWLGFLLKAGLTPSTDLELGFESLRDHVRIEETGGSPISDRLGPSDLVLRFKWNLWGNDGGPTALALMPYLDLPTSAEGGDRPVEGGLIVPFAADGPAGTGLGAMVQVDWLEDADGDGLHAEWVGTATAGHDLVGSLAGFVEVAAALRPAREGPWLGAFNTGLLYAVTPDLQLDGGVRLGISDAADGVEIFLGFAIRR